MLAKHYYSEVPDYARLRRHPELWRRPIALEPLGLDLDEQLHWLGRTCAGYQHEVADPAWYAALTDRMPGDSLGRSDAQLLHCFVRTHRPRRVIEVGGGLSTAVLVGAARANEAEGASHADITTIEPFPSAELLALDGASIVHARAQGVPATLFDELVSGDLLFVDSTHAVKTGSEVVPIFLEVIPALAPGVVVQIHDVNLPYLHHRLFGRDPYDCQESVLLAALLVGNERLRVLSCGSALHYLRLDDLRRILPTYAPKPDRGGIEVGPTTGGDFHCSTYLVVR